MRYAAMFMPEVWVGDHAQPVDAQGPAEWDCTLAVACMPDEYRERILAAARDGVIHDMNDHLKDDPHAPEWVRGWRGPFEIYIREVDTTIEEDN